VEKDGPAFDDAERIENFGEASRRIKRRMLRCRQIDINRGSLEGRRAACNYAPCCRHTPVQSANILSKLSAVTLIVDRFDRGPKSGTARPVSPFDSGNRYRSNVFKWSVTEYFTAFGK